MHDPKRPPREGRRHNIPPAPPPRDQFDLLEGLDEALGLTLWRAVRDVLLWANTPPGARGSLFPPVNENVRERLAAAEKAVPELAGAIRTFAFLAQAPEEAHSTQIADACKQVAAWAERLALLPAVVHFAEAAAFTQPLDPARAVDAGWTCRKAAHGEFPERAAAWYQRAFALAVRTRNRKETIRALTGYGALMKDIGRFEEARKAYERAARRAKRTGRRRQAAVAHHYLFALAAETADMEAAVEHAGQALALYPLHDQRLPYLAHDFSFLLVRFGHYRLALRLQEMVLAKLERPDELVLVLGVAARAAGGAALASRYQALEKSVLELAHHYEEFGPAALNNLAAGAYLLGYPDRARSYAASALDVARARHDAVAEQDALDVLSTVNVGVPGFPKANHGPDPRIATLTRRLAARLRQWRRRNPRIHT